MLKYLEIMLKYSESEFIIHFEKYQEKLKWNNRWIDGSSVLKKV